MISYLALLACRFIWQRLPLRVGYALAGLIGDLTYLVWHEGRRHAQANMRQVAGDEALARKLARQSLRNYCKYLADFMRFPLLTGEDIDRLVHCDRWHLFDRALASGKGVIFATLHIGNWDLGGAAIGRRGYPFYVLVDAFDQAALNRKVLGAREDKGVGVIPVQGVPKRMVQVLRRNGVLGILVDRPVQDGVEVQFFGAPARVPAGAAALSLKTGATILPGCLVRNRDNTFTGLIGEPIYPSPTGHRDEDLRELTQRIMTSLEAMIRDHPEQWYMFRPMWRKEALPMVASQERGVVLERC